MTVVDEIRALMRTYGWRISTQQERGRWSMTFESPLSPTVITYDMGIDPSPSRLRLGLMDYIKRREEELVATQSAKPPRRKRRLLGDLRGVAGNRHWPKEVFVDVVNVLHHSGVLTTDEWKWLLAVGPVAVSKHVLDHPPEDRGPRP